MADNPTSESEQLKSQQSSTLKSTSNATLRPLNRESLVVPPSPRLNANRGSILAENPRHVPASPRTTRPTSMSQSAILDLLNDPPTTRSKNPDFVGRDWKSVQVHEVVDETHVRFVEYGTSVEEATELLISSGSPNVVLIRESSKSRSTVGTFDYSDLNAYLLLVVGLSRPDEDHIKMFNELAQKGREGKAIPMKDVKDVGRKEPLIFLPRTASLAQAVEIFGSGIHRIIIVKEKTTNVVGVLTQLRLVEFFWENRGNFSPIEPLFHKTLRDLEMGTHSVFAIDGDKPLTAALEIINNEGITSLPVLDNQRNVVGNISHVDVRLLTKSTAHAFLRGTCLHFISVMLSERGMDDGKDSYPVFYVNDYSTLAHTVAKLVATRSHRMWIVDSPSPASSGPPTPSLSASIPLSIPSLSNSLPSLNSTQIPISANPSTGPPYSLSSMPHVNNATNAATIASTSMSGRLSGVVSLTDILNLFARGSGLHPIDPEQVRRQRRRSSSSSMRRSVESFRSESVGGSSAAGDESSRRGSMSGRRV